MTVCVKYNGLSRWFLIGQREWAKAHFLFKILAHSKHLLYLCDMKSKKTLLELSSIYENFTLYEINQFLTRFKKGREELMAVMAEAKMLSDYDPNKEVVITRLKEELKYANLNIATLVNAIMCHESKIIETRTTRILGTIKIPLN